MPGDSELESARLLMLDKDLIQRGIQSPRVLEALRRVPREQFVPPDARALAYGDQALQIDCGQTISQPFIVALMTEALQLSGAERVLEIGTGSGYQTAVLAELAAEVFTIERHAALSRQAERLLTSLGYRNVHYRIGDGTRGWPPHAPFERIIITAASKECPPALWEQLSDGGILVGPFGGEESQLLKRLRREGDRCRQTTLTSCRFVPLLPDSGQQGERLDP